MINQPIPPADKKSRLGFHPKRFFKAIQQRLYLSPSLYLIFCFIVPVVLMYLIYVILWTTFGGDGTPLVLDLYYQYTGFFEALRRFVYGDASLLYSFGRSLGGEFMGIYAYYLASPLSYIVALFPQDRIQEAITCILLLKTGLSGLTFGFYLHKRTKNPNKIAVFIFALIYSLSSFAVVQQSNTMWIDAMIWLPIFAYSLENLITRRSFKLYVISLAAILASNYYIGYMVCIFTVLYFCYYYFSKSQQEINPRSERLHFVRTGARFAAFSILAAMISAFILIAGYYSLGFGKTEFSDPNWSLTAKFDIIDFLTKLLPGAYDTVEPSGLPFVYCGLISLILLPVYFTAKKVSSREKVASAAFLAVFIISFIVKPIDLIWHGFSTPNWLNARYAFLFCFIVLVLAYKGFGNLKRTSEKFILVICGLLVLFIAVAEKFELESYITTDEKLPTFSCIWFSVFFAVALLVLLCLHIRASSKKNANIISAVLATVVCVELLCNGVACVVGFNQDVVYSRYSRYQNHIDGLREMAVGTKKYDDGFYRMEKTAHRTRSDNMALGLKGISNSTSTLNADAIQFVNYMGYTGRSHLTIYNGGTPFSDSLLGIKYVIDQHGSERFDNIYEPISVSNEDYQVYKNPYAMSFAYGVNSAVSDFKIDEYNTFFARYNAMIQTMLGDEERIQLFEPVRDVIMTPIDCTKQPATLGTKIVTEEDKDGILKLSYVAPYTGNYYFYSPVSAPKAMEIEINNGRSQEYMGGDTNHIIYAGYFEEGEEITVYITIPEDTAMTFRTQQHFLWYLDREVYDSCMTRLMSGPQFKIDKTSEDHHLKGTIKTEAPSQMILTSIPFDKGWKIYVDGIQAHTYETLDALMAFNIKDTGTHTIEMEYSPDCYALGIAISIAGIVAFVALCAAEFVLKRTLLKNRIPPYPDDFWALEDLEESDGTELPYRVEEADHIQKEADTNEDIS